MISSMFMASFLLGFYLARRFPLRVSTRHRLTHALKMIPMHPYEGAERHCAHRIKLRFPKVPWIYRHGGSAQLRTHRHNS